MFKRENTQKSAHPPLWQTCRVLHLVTTVCHTHPTLPMWLSLWFIRKLTTGIHLLLVQVLHMHSCIVKGGLSMMSVLAVLGYLLTDTAHLHSHNWVYCIATLHMKYLYIIILTGIHVVCNIITLMTCEALVYMFVKSSTSMVTWSGISFLSWYLSMFEMLGIEPPHPKWHLI